jgi:hypothetical protein
MSTTYIEVVHPLFILVYWGGGWSAFGSTRHCGHQWTIVPAPGDYYDGEIGGMIDRGNQSTRKKPVPVPLCPSQTAHTAWTRTRAAAVGSQRLTAWATARPFAALTYDVAWSVALLGLTTDKNVAWLFFQHYLWPVVLPLPKFCTYVWKGVSARSME